MPKTAKFTMETGPAPKSRLDIAKLLRQLADDAENGLLETCGGTFVDSDGSRGYFTANINGAFIMKLDSNKGFSI